MQERVDVSQQSNQLAEHLHHPSLKKGLALLGPLTNLVLRYE